LADRERVYTLNFRAPVGVFTGLGIAGLVDRTVVRDAAGVPFIPGSTVKGRLRFFAERALHSGVLPSGYRFHGTGKPHCKNLAAACTLCKLFGNSSIPAFVRVGQAVMGEPWRSLVVSLLASGRNPVVRPDVEIRPGIALSRRRRTTLLDHLFLEEAVPAGLEFEGRLALAGSITPAEEAFLVGVGALVDALGARKATGRGALEGGVRIRLEAAP
jgi:CRISPR/Cas system CSM-associated protein Csm3 (group 7 of RAMP superfamily)